MILDFSDQFHYLLWSIVFGCVLCIVYDLLKTLRILLKGKTPVVFVTDFIFMLAATFMTVFLSMGFTRGATRYYVILGELSGFLLVRFTISRLLFPVWVGIVRACVDISKKIYEFVAKTAKKLLHHLVSIMYNVIRRSGDKPSTCSASHKLKKGKRHYETESAEE